MGPRLLSGCGDMVAFMLMRGCRTVHRARGLHPLGWFGVVPGLGTGCQERLGNFSSVFPQPCLDVPCVDVPGSWVHDCHGCLCGMLRVVQPCMAGEEGFWWQLHSL